MLKWSRTRPPRRSLSIIPLANRLLPLKRLEKLRRLLLPKSLWGGTLDGVQYVLKDPAGHPVSFFFFKKKKSFLSLYLLTILFQIVGNKASSWGSFQRGAPWVHEQVWTPRGAAWANPNHSGGGAAKAAWPWCKFSYSFPVLLTNLSLFIALGGVHILHQLQSGPLQDYWGLCMLHMFSRSRSRLHPCSWLWRTSSKPDWALLQGT